MWIARPVAIVSLLAGLAALGPVLARSASDPADKEQGARPEREREPREKFAPYGEALAPELFWSDTPKLGVQLVETTPELREHLGGAADAGVLVSKILKGMPAERAGLKVGDLIVGVAGRSVASAQDLVEALAHREGQRFPIEIIRNRERKTVEVSLPDPTADRPTGPRV